MTDAVDHRIETFVAKYTPAIAAQLRDARQRLRAHFPRGVEMVFDNYNALVFGIDYHRPVARLVHLDRRLSEMGHAVLS